MCIVDYIGSSRSILGPALNGNPRRPLIRPIRCVLAGQPRHRSVQKSLIESLAQLGTLSSAPTPRAKTLLLRRALRAFLDMTESIKSQVSKYSSTESSPRENNINDDNKTTKGTNIVIRQLRVYSLSDRTLIQTLWQLGATVGRQI